MYAKLVGPRVLPPVAAGRSHAAVCRFRGRERVIIAETHWAQTMCIASAGAVCVTAFVASGVTREVRAERGQRANFWTRLRWADELLPAPGSGLFARMAGCV